MDDTHFAEKVRMALQLAREEAWDHQIPRTPIRLSMLLRLLSNRFPAYWNEDAEYLEISDYPGMFVAKSGCGKISAMNFFAAGGDRFVIGPLLKG